MDTSPERIRKEISLVPANYQSPFTKAIRRLTEAGKKKGVPQTEFLYLSVEDARWCLSKIEKNEREQFIQRAASRGHVVCMARDMKEGKWHDNGDPITFDKENYFRGGQQRALAVICAGRDWWGTSVACYASKEGLNQGRPQTFGDDLVFSGLRRPKVVATATRFIGKFCPHYGTSFSRDQLKTVLYELNYLEKIEKVMDKLGPTEKLIRGSLIGVFSFALPLDEKRILRGFSQFQSGVNLESDSPWLLLRASLLDGDKKHRLTGDASIVKATSYYLMKYLLDQPVKGWSKKSDTSEGVEFLREALNDDIEKMRPIFQTCV